MKVEGAVRANICLVDKSWMVPNTTKLCIVESFHNLRIIWQEDSIFKKYK